MKRKNEEEEWRRMKREKKIGRMDHPFVKEKNVLRRIVPGPA